MQAPKTLTRQRKSASETGCGELIKDGVLVALVNSIVERGPPEIVVV